MPSGAPRDGVPRREALFQRQDQRIAERRQAGDREQDAALVTTSQLASRRKARRQQHDAEQADRDEEIRRQREEAENLGEDEEHAAVPARLRYARLPPRRVARLGLVVRRIEAGQLHAASRPR